MKELRIGVLTATLFAIFSLATVADAGNCENHSNDAGRWSASSTPTDRLEHMCRVGYDQYQANKGKMVLLGRNAKDCDDAVRVARNYQSQHGDDWFLWNDIKCDNGMEIQIR
jgi:hypothetical protein